MTSLRNDYHVVHAPSLASTAAVIAHVAAMTAHDSSMTEDCSEHGFARSPTIGHTRFGRGEKLVFGGLAVAARAVDGSSVQVTLEDLRPCAVMASLSV